MFETLRGLGYAGGYDTVRRYARSWGPQRAATSAAAYVPLSFAPGEAYQFDWRHEVVLINGTTVTVKVAHLRLCHSWMLFVRAYPRETQEMVFDAHDRGFAFFKGACTRGIYDNMKTAVDVIFVGRERAYNRRFSRCAATIWLTLWRARQRPGGRRAKPRTRSSAYAYQRSVSLVLASQDVIATRSLWPGSLMPKRVCARSRFTPKAPAEQSRRCCQIEGVLIGNEWWRSGRQGRTMFSLWLNQPSWLIVLILALCLASTALLIHWLSHHGPTRRIATSLVGVQGAFFTSISVLFALFSGFLGNDVWEQQRQAFRAVQVERDSLLAINTLSIATVSDMAPIRAALRAYVEAVVGDEWPRKMKQGESARTAQALGELLREVARPEITAEAGAAAHAALLDLTLRVRTARNDRLTISSAGYDAEKWATVLVLAVLTQVGIGLVQLDRSRPQAVALFTFTTAAVVTLGLLAGREKPFDGAHAIRPDAIRTVLLALPPPG